MNLDDEVADLNRSYNTELHYHVFKNDLNAIKKYIEQNRSSKKFTENNYLSQIDNHGNTPLHIACMLGYTDIVKLLVQSGAIVKVRNKQFWTPLNEAISYGNREMIKCTLEKFEKEVDKIVEDSKPKILHALNEMADFYVEIKWDFESWIPLVSRFLPSDLCKIHKKGTKIRMDCTLGDLTAAKRPANNQTSSSTDSTNPSTTNSSKALNRTSTASSISPLNWQRGDLTFLFDLNKIGKKNSIIFMDNKRKVFLNLEKDINIEHNIEKEVDLYLSREMVYLKLLTKSAQFEPSQIGWFSKRDKIEIVNGYTCQFYDCNNLFIMSKLRNEHLTDEEVKKTENYRKKVQSLNNGGGSNTSNKALTANVGDDLNSDNDLNINEGDLDFFDVEFKPSLEPPPDCHVDWNEYLSAPNGDWPVLGRKLRIKESKKEFKAQVAMSKDFPLTLNDLNKLLDALVPLAKFRKLKEFLNAKLPPGFPVKIDIPIVATVTAKVSFQNFKKNPMINEQIFNVPTDYTEEEDLNDQNKNESSSQL